MDPRGELSNEAIRFNDDIMEGENHMNIELQDAKDKSKEKEFEICGSPWRDEGLPPTDIKLSNAVTVEALRDPSP